jgi:2-desacetyl-2-hydroxyethyl bacteriochlorophyllide A dehydrogenase
MPKMKAAIYSDIQQIEIQEVDYQKPPPGYIIMDTKCTGICGSDLHNYFGNWPPSPGLAAGHETCGLVAEVGEGVTDLKPGDRIVAECFSHCGTCVYCQTGHYNHCRERKWVSHNSHGGFAEYTTLHASGVFKLPDSLSFEEGALVEPLAVAYRAVAQGQATYQDRVAIIGGGTIGQVCLAMAKAVGVKESLITVKYEQQAQLAQALGADHVIDIGRTDPRDYVNALTNGLGMDVVIETVGGGQNFNDALAIVRRRGRVVLVAGYHSSLEVDLAPLVWKEPVVTGSNCYGYTALETDFQATIDLIASGKIPVTKLVTHRFPLLDIADAFKVAADKTSGAIKVHIYQD